MPLPSLPNIQHATSDAESSGLDSLRLDHQQAREGGQIVLTLFFR